MDNQNKAGDATDHALTGMSTVAKLFGIAAAAGNPAIAAGTATGAVAVETIVQAISKRRSDKHINRLEKLVNSLALRLTRLENSVLESPDIDLFDEIVAKAITDEDEDKTELYAALVEYWMKHKLKSYEVRLLGNAIKELTVDEMNCFYEFIVTGSPKRTRIIPELLQDAFWSRIVSLGLLGGIGHMDMINSQNVTKLGRKLFEIYQLSGKAK